MAFDMALAANGDIILSGGRDISGVSGTDLVNQRIRLRLSIQRGTWFYDSEKTLGSNLHNVTGKDPNASLQIESHVQEALVGMDDIEILQVEQKYADDARSMVVWVGYDLRDLADEVSGSLEGDFQQTTVTLPLEAGR
jgi:hypothetical protein